jgi:hypothetical protein
LDREARKPSLERADNDSIPTTEKMSHSEIQISTIRPESNLSFFSGKNDDGSDKTFSRKVAVPNKRLERAHAFTIETVAIYQTKDAEDTRATRAHSNFFNV